MFLLLFTILESSDPLFFQQHLEETPRHPKGIPQVPQDGQREPKGWPKGSQGQSKGSQRDPKVTPKEAKGTPKTPKGSQRDKIYISNSRSTAPADVMLCIEILWTPGTRAAKTARVRFRFTEDLHRGQRTMSYQYLALTHTI